MKQAGLGTLLLLVFSLALYAQNEAQSAPYVSRLRTDVEGSFIKLLWQDSGPKGSKYVVYRYTNEITIDNFAKAERLAVVQAGKQTYVDQPPDKQDYYYAVLVEDPSGKINKIFVPFRNVTTQGVSVKALASQRPTFADVTALSASLSGESIDLSFKSSEPNRQLVVYRNTSPIDSESRLLSSVSVAVIPSSQTSYEDTPVPGISYYYAVVDSSMLAEGKIALVPGQNTTSSGIEVPIRTNAMGQVEYAPKRPRPLPFLTLNSNIQTGAPLPGPSPSVVPDQTPLSQSTAAAVSSLLGTLPAEKPVEIKPVVLDPEKGEVAGGGEEYLLKQIVDGPFASSDWKKAISELTGYLNIRHSAAIENRARFYLGEAYYFDGQYRKSFLEFLYAENALYTEVQPWMNALFTKLPQTTQQQ